MCEIKKISFPFKIHTLIFTIFLLFFLTDLVYGGLKYYYLHVGSFRAEKKAAQFAQDLQKMGLETLVRGEEITDKGFWYRIYIGPFYSRLEAELESRELKGKGIIDYAAVHKKDSLLSSNLEEKPEPIEKSEQAVPEKIVSEITPPPEEAAPVSKPPSETPPIEEKPPITERPIDRVQPTEEKTASEKAPPPLKAKKPVREVYPKSPLKFLKKGYGRNTRQWGLTLGIKHIYRDIQTMVIKREGSVSLEDDKKDEFPTQMHMTTFQLRLGLTNYLEIFGNVGTAFDDPSELGFAYGGGLRLNLFEIKGFYSALQGEYLSGDFEEEYISDQNNKWQKETEWEEINAKVELGFTRSRFTAYIGGTYFHYDEDTKRQQLEGFLPLDIAQDEIEEENSFGAYGGIDIHFTPVLIANLEGEVLSQKSISLALEILF
jgi:hypothetical protein